MLPRTFKLAGACVLIFATRLAFAQHAAPISAVTLYPGSATIERSIQISAGASRVEIGPLPANFDPQTLRVLAEQGIHVGQITVRDAATTEAVNPKQAELEARIEKLQDQLAPLEAEMKAAALMQAFLERHGNATPSDKAPPLDGKSFATMVQTVRDESSATFQKVQRLEIQKRDLTRKIEALERDLERLHVGTRDLRRIAIQFSAEKPGNLRLSYQVNGAGWQPSYRAELNSTDSTVALERLATVSQKTGEDWSNVKLKLSTGQPRLSPQARDPQPWVLQYQKKQLVGQASLAERLPASAAPAKALSKLEEKADYVAPVIESHGNFTTEFEVPARASVPSDGREVSLALGQQSFPVKQRIRVVPRLEKAGVVTAEAQRPEGVWLSGPMQLLRDGSHVGSAHWDTQQTEGFLFSFGRDELLRVSVNPIKVESGSSGFFGQRSQRRIAELYTLTSFHRKPVDVLVLEPTPMSAAEDIKVKTSFEPKPGIENWEQRRGVVGWEATMKPSETLKLKVDYQFSYPQDGYVVGLP